MTATLTLALDAMGGDHAPEMVVKGAAAILPRFPQVRFLLFGDAEQIEPLLRKYPTLRDRAELRHTADRVHSEDKPSQALRRGRNSSMRLAIDAVAKGEAQAVVSAGNTGALMAMAKFVLRTLPGIERPALASFFPTLKGETVMLDLGANVECDSRNLVQFAVMGANLAHSALGRHRPRVGLLNVGVEELKGNDAVRGAAELLRAVQNPPFEFVGFVEGDDITKGEVDVIVTDGFTGNVALKTAEGTAKLMGTLMRAAFQRSILTKLGYLLAYSGLAMLKARIDPRFYNGGVMLGLNGIAVKSHGGTDEVGFAAALEVAIDMANDRLIERIRADFSGAFAEALTNPPPSIAGPGSSSISSNGKDAVSEPVKIAVAEVP
ncbi:phosphate acyltransferase PlsX [Ferrovibrio sp.]|uniref:phosphate acyltransferase PlsX n=1 Tax=Ferrovibrio sp. TaxID=1917215 RepID=UPI001B78EA79|nr:phosphate acyltransferase PlsX [Ferrovibrio sp.]MBP7066497.1 phosphate acyltransferase PlsX [Ferrovibrio sp.]